MTKNDDYQQRAADFLRQWQDQMTRQMNNPDAIAAMLAAMQQFGAPPHDANARRPAHAPDARHDAIGDLTERLHALEQQLHSEIVGKTAQLQVTDKGLVVTFAADALFDQGKSKLKTEAYAALDAVYRVLSGIASGSRIEIGGHTDNEAVQASGWKSGWELSAARALSVVHYFQDEKGIAGWRLSVAVFGEYRPVADNSTKEGRQANRRIEIVITPRMPQVQEIALPQTKTSEATR
ncbi:MAG TPA: OmpA family protein [Candidatus Omnitrophota bacterium]|nr:OmpA family protein [Candidatus Omnitrophota bacterium]